MLREGGAGTGFSRWLFSTCKLRFLSVFALADCLVNDFQRIPENRIDMLFSAKP